MRILQFIDHTDILQLDIQKLIDTLQRPPDVYVILEFDRDFVVHQRFEETMPKAISTNFSITYEGFWEVEMGG